jgi:hypothetical protein
MLDSPQPLSGIAACTAISAMSSHPVFPLLKTAGLANNPLEFVPFATSDKVT